MTVISGVGTTNTHSMNANAAPLDPEADAKKFDHYLRNEGLFGSVFFGYTRGDAVKECIAILDKYQGDPAALDALLNKIGDKDLKLFESQLGATSNEKRTQLFHLLAKNASGEDLGKIWSNLGRDDQQALAQAIAQDSSGQTKADFVKSIATQTTKQDDKTSRGIFSNDTTTYGSPAALSVATVLGSMSGKDLTSALAGLDDNQLQAVMNAAEQKTKSSEPFVPNHDVSYDTAPLTAIIEHAKTADPVQKARVFRDAAVILDDIHSSSTAPFASSSDAGAQAKAVASAMTSLIQSDPKGIVDQLRLLDNAKGEHTEAGFCKGQALISYASELMREGNTEPLSKLACDLRFGLKPDKNHPDTYILTPHGKTDTGEPFYENAQDLGYFVGALVVASEQSTGDKTGQIQMAGTIFGGIEGVLGTAGNPMGSITYLAGTPMLLWLNNVASVSAGKNGETARAFYDKALYSTNNQHEIQGAPYNDFMHGLHDVVSV
jgi:hypothetical protein